MEQIMINQYEAKQAARRARYAERAAKAKTKAQSAYSAAKAMSDCIPFGQPILIGHHSEGRDRRFRARITKGYERASVLEEKAQYYAHKATTENTAISSDDPEAVIKLLSKLESLKKSHEMMKKANAVVRKYKTDEERRAALTDAGFTAELASKMLTPDFTGQIGFPRYALTNSNARIKDCEKRINQLRAVEQRQDKEEEGEGYRYREDTAENRVMFFFQGKPSDEVRQLLKRNGFKWSPSRGAWVRMLNRQGVNTALWLRKDLDRIMQG
jgi:vacuolar-type H+-ATPase subunit I/STV1